MPSEETNTTNLADIPNGAKLEPHDSRAIANLYVRRAREDGEILTILPLVKLVYLAHGWTLGYTGKPLIADAVEAWKFGPVVKKVRRAFRGQGMIIHDYARDLFGNVIKPKRDLTEDEDEIVWAIYDKYFGLFPSQLSELTRGKGTPWNRFEGKFYRTIPQDDIREYYQGRVRALRAEKNAA